MGTRFRSWWEQVKQHRVAILVVTIILIVAIGLIIVGYRFDWTGFNGNNKSGKTLWDWMQLLFIPVVLAVAGFWFNHRERKAAEFRAENEKKAAKFRAWNEQKAAEFRAQAEREIEQQHAKTERDIAEDNRREAVLQEYINKMSELLLHENLRKSEPEDEVRKIARVRTLTVLPRLDGKRKGTVLQFLHESRVIKKDNSNLSLRGADLSGADLSGADLIGDSLDGANLTGANLTRAFLGGAYFWGADLNGVNLDGANMIGANMTGVDLTGADLTGTNLYITALIGANLTGANLRDAHGINIEELEKHTKSLKGATMPDGSIHP